MANVGEEMRFCSECSTKFFRLPVTSSWNTFLINTGRNSVSSIQNHDRKPVQTWTLTYPHSFTSPVVFNDVDGTVCCVVDNDSLMVWPLVAEDLKKARKVKLQSPVFAVIALPSVGCLVIFASGVAIRLDRITTSSIEQKLDFVGELVWTDAALDSNDDIIVTHLCKKENEYTLHTYHLKNGENSLLPLSCHSIVRSERSLKCWSLNRLSQPPAFLAMWSDGEIHSYRVTDEEENEVIFTVSEVSDGSSVAIDVMDMCHLAVVKTMPTVNANSAVMEIWDLKYTVVKAKKSLKHPLPKNFQMKSVNSSVFLSTLDGIVTVPTNVEASTLSAVIGKSTISKIQNGACYTWSSDEPFCADAHFSPSTEKGFPENVVCARLTAQKFEEVATELSFSEVQSFCCYLSELKDISECELVKMLQVALKKSKNCVDADKDGGDNSKKDVLLNSVFKISFSDIFLRQYLRKLSFEETVDALRFLVLLFESQLFSTDDDPRPSDIQVVNWVQLLLQSHFEELLLSTDESVLQLLAKLRKVLDEKVDIYDELDGIEHLLKIQKKKDILPQKNVDSKYCIEKLYF